MTEDAAASAPVKKDFDWAKLIAYVAIFGAAGYAYDNWDSVSTRYLGFPYTCKNMVQELTGLDTGPMAPRLVGVLDHVSVSDTPTRTECSGIGVFSTGLKAPINYRAYEEGGQWWLQFEPA